MTLDSSAKADLATAPQTPIIRYLGLIKAVSLIMAILIVVALAVIVVTIYGRLTTMEKNAGVHRGTITVPAGVRVSSVSFDDNGKILMLFDSENGQYLWQLDQAGQLQREIEILRSSP